MINQKTLIIIILLIFFLLIPITIQEDFITWFLPFYNKGTKGLTKDTPKYLTSNLIYGQMKYDYIQQLDFGVLSKMGNNLVNSYYNFLTANLLKSAKIKKLNVKAYNKPLKLIKNTNDNENVISVVSTPLLVDLMSSNIKDMKNINVIIVSNYRYIFFITTKLSGITNLSEINGKNINFGEKYSDESIFGEDIVSNLNISGDVKVNKFNYSSEIAIQKLVSGEIDGMFFTDLYPSQFLDKVILDDLTKMIILLPIKNISYELFKKRHPYVNEVALDLNALPKNYLPLKIKNLEYTIFRPDMISYRYPDLMICNKSTQPRVSYSIVNSIVDNLNILNKSSFYLKNGWNYLAFPAIANSLFIPTHIGAKIYYNQITVNTTNPDAYCKYFIGNSKCNDVRIEQAKNIMATQ